MNFKLFDVFYQNKRDDEKAAVVRFLFCSAPKSRRDIICKEPGAPFRETSSHSRIWLGVHYVQKAS